MRKRKADYSPAMLRHAADMEERRGGRLLSSASECEDHPEEAQEFRKQARRAQTNANEYRTAADIKDLE